MWRLIGQPRVISLLQRSIDKDSLAHAYLFVGPPHIGKLTLAVDLAQAINCQTDKSPCGQCSSCQKIAKQEHADVQFIGLLHTSERDEPRNRAEISIEQIRQIQYSANLPPFEGKYRLFIIDNAEYLSHEAANCLLKTLEEPLPKVLFILLANNIKTIPDTVISRCQKLNLIPLSASEVEKELVARSYVEMQKARLMARICQGSIGWAISASQDDGLIRRYFDDRDSILNIINSGYEERFAYAAQIARQFNLRRDITIESLYLWLNLWHDILLIKAGFIEAIINIDIEERLSRMTDEIDLFDIRHFIRKIQQAIQNLKLNVNPRLVLEVLMLDIPVKNRERVES